jgi:hypothetical protein
MKKNINLLILLSAILLASCSKELQKVNENPNALETPDATTLLSNTIVAEFYNNANVVWTLGNGYDQYMTYSQSYYNQGTRYSPITNDPYWTAMYEAARDANTLYSIGQQKNNALLQAAALTLRSYAFSQLTDLCGYIPFTQSLQGAQGIYTPTYDKQQTVYTDPALGILPSLRRADSLLKASPNGLLAGDLLYNSNTTSWRKFINALRLRYLLRISSKQDPSTEMQAIVSDGTLMQNASESATLQLPTVTPYNFVSLTERSGDFAVKYLNSTLYDVFQSTGDTARLSSYFDPTANATAGAFSFSNYGGMPLVVDATTDQMHAASNFSHSFTTGSNANLIKAKIITYAEQEFILSEAALKGFIPGGTAAATDYYDNGVTGAFEGLGLDANAANNYLSHSEVALNSSSMDIALKQIITQKWIGNINNGFEGWIEYRRTGYPDFQTGGAANLNKGVIPSRFLYPTSEQTINSTNYNTELQNMGGTENTTYKAWWEK